MHGTVERWPRSGLKASAQQKIRTQHGQGQGHQFIIRQHLFAGAVKGAQLFDQFGIGFRLGEATVVIGPHRRCGGARGKQRHRIRAAKLTQGMGDFAGQQRTQAVTKHRVRRLERGAQFAGQLHCQRAHVGVQRFVEARPASRKFHRLHLQPRWQLAPPAAVNHGTGAGIRQAQQGQLGHCGFLRSVV
jgi:hypothetical protein